MKLIDTNKLNRFWRRGVRPIAEEVARKLDISRLINNGLCNTPGKYPLDAAYGKNLQDQIDEINGKLPYDTLLRYNDASYIKFNNNRSVRTGDGLLLISCDVNIVQNVPDTTGLFSVDSMFGFLFVTQPHTGKSFPILINNRAAKAWGMIDACNYCVLHGVLAYEPAH